MRKALLVLFFLSGFAALTYQIVWVGMLELVYGVTSFAVATVLAAYMAGLALGSYWGGKYVDKRRNPLAVFSGLQIGIAGFALLFPILVSGLTYLYVFTHRLWASDYYLFSLLRFLIAFLLLLVPTTMMGATLPVLAKVFVRVREQLGSDVSSLYSVNNWGAVLGTLATGFVLLEILGVREASQVAAAISASVGVASFYLSRRLPEPSRETEAPPPVGKDAASVGYPRYVLHVILWVFAIQGFTSLAYEVIWTRILASSMDVVDVYTYSAVIAMFIAGLAIGSLLIGRLADRRASLLGLLAGLEIGIGLSAILLLPLFHVVEWHLRPDSVQSWGKSMAFIVIWLGALMLVPTTLMGATFPVVSKICVANFRELGRRIGLVGCLDSVGSVFGAFAGGFLLIRFVGMQKSVFFLAATNILLGLVIVAAHPALRPGTKAAVLATLLAFSAGVSFLIPVNARFLPPFLAWGNIARGAGNYVLFYDEGADATVVAAQRLDAAEKVLFVNGGAVAGTSQQLQTTQILQGHLPLLLYEAQNGKPPRRVLTVGLGSGGTSGALSLHDLAEIHCVELSPGVRKAAEQVFQSVNHNVFADPRYHVFIQDGRTYVLADRTKYDVIMTESVHPAYAGNASLYSRDYYRYCKERLSENGVISVWVPLFGLSADDLKMVCKTFLDVFPHAALWHGNNGLNKHIQLMATQQELSIDFDRFAKRLQEPKIRQDLARLDLDNVYSLLSSLWLDERALREYCQDARVTSDDHPYLAFSSPRSSARETAWTWVQRLEELRERRTPVLPHVKSLGRTQEEVDRNSKALATEFDVAGYLTEGFNLLVREDCRNALRLGEKALDLNPSNKTCRRLLGEVKYAIAKRRIAAGQVDEAFATLRDVLKLDPDSALAYQALCQIHDLRGELPEAIEAGEELRRRLPEYPTLCYRLAIMYAQEGAIEKARTLLEEVQRELPGDRAVEKTLAALPPRP